MSDSFADLYPDQVTTKGQLVQQLNRRQQYDAFSISPHCSHPADPEQLSQRSVRPTAPADFTEEMRSAACYFSLDGTAIEIQIGSM
jgi:hypothetical protein